MQATMLSLDFVYLLIKNILNIFKYTIVEDFKIYSCPQN